MAHANMAHTHVVGALVLAAALATCIGPEPHAAPEGAGGGATTTSSGGSGATGGATGGSGGSSSTCGDTIVDPGELCFHPLVTVSGGTNLGVGKILDIDDDGDLDIVGLGSDNVVNAFLANPKGVFGMPTPIASGVVFGRFGHFTDDALPDFVAALAGLTVGFFENQGGASFASAITVGMHGFMTNFIVGDIDGDGLDDFVVLRCSDQQCMTPNVTQQVYIADGATNPFFAPVQITGDPAVVGSLTTLNMDVRLDLLTLDTLDDEIQIYMNMAGALPAMPVTVAIEPAGQSPNGIAIRDIDSNGGPELAITHFAASSEVAIMTSTLTGVISPSGSVPVGGTQFSPHLMDIDHDGTIDLIVGVDPATGDNQIVVARGTAGSFEAPQGIAQDAKIAKQMLIEDLDEDGAFDVVIRSTEATGILLLMSNP